jgi:mRNA-degrading endonuclease toxin of MazEF toxin-antitoxin module
MRPCVAVSDPVVTGDQRYPMIAVVPLTGTPGEGLLYPRLEPGPSGLRKPSFALVDQVRSVDKSRVLEVYSTVRSDELRAVDEGLRPENGPYDTRDAPFTILPTGSQGAVGARLGRHAGPQRPRSAS